MLLWPYKRQLNYNIHHWLPPAIGPVQVTYMTLTQTQTDALNILNRYIGPAIQQKLLQQKQAQDIVDFAHKNFYIPENSFPIKLLPHQQSLLRYALDPDRNYQTIVYSTVKKSGKTAIAGLVARWVAETWGQRNEVYLVANDLEQARGRIFQAATTSIELTPGYNTQKRTLPGRWRIIENKAVHQTTGSIMKAISSDYKGEAGSNPTATFWSELWGYQSEASHRLWDELTPVPTRERSLRYVETYAGYEGESDLLETLYKLGMSGRRLTHNDIDWPFPDQPPIWVNERAHLFMYWDSGAIARRMPWQTPQYYEAQASTLRELAFRRLHLNEWTSSVSEFLPVEWWDACIGIVPPIDKSTPMVLGVDAATSSDCCAIVGVTRHPTLASNIAVRLYRVWYPQPGHPIDLTATMDVALREICSKYNVIEIAYDAYQLHKMMTDLRNDAVAWCRPFSQGNDRAVADKQLYDLIRDRRIIHSGDEPFRDHIRNSAAKTSKDEDTKLRIIKKGQDKKVDLVVALSMGAYECLRLML